MEQLGIVRNLLRQFLCFLPIQVFFKEEYINKKIREQLRRVPGGSWLFHH
jgi:hypothetical protein